MCGQYILLFSRKPNVTCVRRNLLNIKEEDLFGKLLSLWHKIHQQKILCCLMLLLHIKKKKCSESCIFLWQPLSSCFDCFTWEMYFPGAYIKNCCVKFIYFQASNCRREANWKKSFVVAFYTSSFCLWEVAIAVIHGRIRSASIENSFSIVVRLLKSGKI